MGGDLVALNQVNVAVPRTLIGRGEVDIVLTVDGKATTVVSFSTAGQYVLRAAAEDGLMTTYRDLTLNVTK